jgi:hypothetical protein
LNLLHQREGFPQRILGRLVLAGLSIQQRVVVLDRRHIDIGIAALLLSEGERLLKYRFDFRETAGADQQQCQCIVAAPADRRFRSEDPVGRLQRLTNVRFCVAAVAIGLQRLTELQERDGVAGIVGGKLLLAHRHCLLIPISGVRIQPGFVVGARQVVVITKHLRMVGRI